MQKTQLEAFLNAPKTADFIKVALKNADIEYEKLSDFEKFALTLERWNALLGSKVQASLYSLIYTLTGENLSFYELGSREEQKRVWLKVHGISAEKKTAQSTEEKCSVDLYKSSKENECIDLFQYIAYPENNLPQSLEEFIHNIVNSRYNAFWIDSSRFEYARPDQYHTRLVYQKIISGEKYKKSEISSLISHVICEARRTKKHDVYFLANDRLDDLEMLLELFEKRKAEAGVHICFRVDNENIFGQVFDIMLKKGKNISSEIIIPEEIELEQLKKYMYVLFDKIPFSRVAISERASDKVNAVISELYCK